MKNFIHKALFISIDLLSFTILFYLVSYIRSNIATDLIPAFETFSIREFLFIFLIIFILMYYERVYTFRYDFWQETHKVFKALFLSFLMVMTLLAILKNSVEYSRLFISIYFFLGILFIPIVKRYSKKFIYRFDYFKKKVLVLGKNEQVSIFQKEIKNNWYLGQESSEKDYESVIIVSKGLNKDELNNLIKEYLNNHRELFVVPYITDISFANSNILEYSNIRSNTIHVENKLLIDRNIIIKATFDRTVALLILPFVLIAHVIISILIRKDSSGDVLYKQIRLGKDDNNFKCYKYRSMYENSKELLEEYLKDNPDEVTYYNEFHKYKNDPRITKVGKVLRATSLDELPQLLNVLRGEMSLVGPRPYMVSESDKLGKNKDLILKVKPGITGLWQVSGRNNLTFKERNDLEIWYVRNWSLELDIMILLKTIKVVLYKVGSK